MFTALGLELRNQDAEASREGQASEGSLPGPPAARDLEHGFVHDQLATGQKLRVLTVVNIFSRFCPAQDPRLSYRGKDVILMPERVCGEIGYPEVYFLFL
jgi:putative transposase